MKSDNRIWVTVLWGFVTVMGSAIGLFIGSMAGERLGFPLGDSLERSLQSIFSFFPAGYLPGMVAGAMYGAVAGFCPGFVQWLAVLRGQYKRSAIWIFLNMFGMALAFSLNSGVYAFLNSLLSNTILVYVIYMFINAFTTGVVIGGLHWLFFARKHKSAFWWLVLNMIGWGILSFVSFIGFMVGDSYYSLMEFVFILIDSVGLALFTGLALYITFPRSVQEAEGTTTI